MRRVYGMYLMRQLTSPLARVAALTILFLALLSKVSLPHVFANVLHVSSVPAFVNFWVVAVASTSTVVQLSILGALLIVAWTAADVVRRPHQAQFSL